MALALLHALHVGLLLWGVFAETEGLLDRVETLVEVLEAHIVQPFVLEFLALSHLFRHGDHLLFGFAALGVPDRESLFEIWEATLLALGLDEAADELIQGLASASFRHKVSYASTWNTIWKLSFQGVC